MTWAQTSRGRALDLLDPQPDDVDIAEIGRALGHQCRYAGCTLCFYSVAEHSLLIAMWLRDEGYDPDVQMAGLLHDAAEAYTGDITWPMQKLLWEAGPQAREVYEMVQRGLDAVIAAKVGIDPDLFRSDAVTSADLRILLDERVYLHDAIPQGWDLVEDMEPLGVRLHCWEPSAAGRRWLVHYRQLGDGLR